jgi:hypothetical protein
MKWIDRDTSIWACTRCWLPKTEEALWALNEKPAQTWLVVVLSPAEPLSDARSRLSHGEIRAPGEQVPLPGMMC